MAQRRWATASGRYKKAAGPPRPCRICGVWLQNLSQRVCRSAECQRLDTNAQQLEFYARYLAEHGHAYTARYAEKRNAAAKEYKQTPKGTAIRRAADHRRRVRLAGGRSERFLNEDIFERDGWICGICHKPVDRDLVHPDPASPSLDHIVPVSQGGDHVRANVRLAHLACNVRRGARGADEQLRLLG
jgi:5-methylcytosine-specific restriction endonuclease McrA